MPLISQEWKAQWLRRQWPYVASDSKAHAKAAVAIVNFNTKDLIAHLLFSLYRILDRARLGPVVVVDNGSSDGSLPFLARLNSAGLIHLISNTEQRYHGPGLNQAMAYLGRLSRRRARLKFRYVWVLDSDTLVLRADTLGNAIAHLEREAAALIGEYQPDPIIAEGYAHVSSLLIDPRMVWRRKHKPFMEHGDPGQPMQISLRAKGVPIRNFPFKKENYILHIGRASLAQLKETRVTDNRYYSWAADHYQPHYSGNPNGQALRAEFLRIFHREIPVLTAEALIDACHLSSPVTIPRPSGSLNDAD